MRNRHEMREILFATHRQVILYSLVFIRFSASLLALACWAIFLSRSVAGEKGNERCVRDNSTHKMCTTPTADKDLFPPFSLLRDAPFFFAPLLLRRAAFSFRPDRSRSVTGTFFPSSSTLYLTCLEDFFLSFSLSRSLSGLDRPSSPWPSPRRSRSREWDFLGVRSERPASSARL